MRRELQYHCCPKFLHMSIDQLQILVCNVGVSYPFLPVVYLASILGPIGLILALGAKLKLIFGLYFLKLLLATPFSLKLVYIGIELLLLKLWCNRVDQCTNTPTNWQCCLSWKSLKIMTTLLFPDSNSAKAVLRARVPPDEAVLPRALVLGRVGRCLHRHHHHGGGHSLRQVKKLQIQR